MIPLVDSLPIVVLVLAFLSLILLSIVYGKRGNDKWADRNAFTAMCLAFAVVSFVASLIQIIVQQ